MAILKKIMDTKAAIEKTKSPYCKRDLEKYLKRLEREVRYGKKF